MDSLRTKSKIPVKAAVRVIQSTAPITKENEQKKNTRVKKTQPVKPHKAYSTSNSKQNSAKDSHRTLMKAKFKAPSQVIRKNVIKHSESAFKSKKPIQSINEESKKSTNLTTRETEYKDSNCVSQPDIEFVADERFRKLILSGRELTPSILKGSNRQYSNAHERPSLYKKFQVSNDPLQHALKAIENIKCSGEDRRFSEMGKMAQMYSPFSERHSLYSKRLQFSCDPYEGVLKNLAELQMKQKLKSSKKVTFNLPSTDSPSETVIKDQDCKVEDNEARLTDISEKSGKGSNHSTPEIDGNVLPVPVLKEKLSSTPELKENMLSTPDNLNLKEVKVDSLSRQDEVEKSSKSSFTDVKNARILQHVNVNSKQSSEKLLCRSIQKEKSDLCKDKLSAATSLRTISNAGEGILTNNDNFLSQGSQHDMKSAPNLQIKNSCIKITNPLLSSCKISERRNFYSTRSESYRGKPLSKLCTPQPVSFYSRAKQTECISPEFFSKSTSGILSHAPIQTPLVLKNLAKNSEDDLSPVCKKLDFSDDSKEDRKEPEDLRENSQTLNIQSILTQHKIMDVLADQECRNFMDDVTFPVEIRRHFLNPIAEMLDEGDEMHFLPVSPAVNDGGS